jgi:hypothetical protein
MQEDEAVKEAWEGRGPAQAKEDVILPGAKTMERMTMALIRIR